MEAARGYFAILIQQEWAKAYAALDPLSQYRWSQNQIAPLDRTYRSNLGFEPSAVHVWACDERGAEATAHAVLTGLTSVTVLPSAGSACRCARPTYGRVVRPVHRPAVSDRTTPNR